jgi:hypothetical protein
MNKRYAFCNFSSIFGYPHPVPSKDEWEISIPRFRGEEWEVPAEHLLDFHDFINRLEIIHEDVQIKLFRQSLEGFSLNWCQSLPNASISSLANFHAAFHLFCKTKFSADLLYPKCCHEFSVLNKDSDNYEDFVAAEDISHHDQEIGDPHYDNHSDAFVIVSNASTDLGCHEDEIVPFENPKDDYQIDTLAGDSFRSATDSKGSPQFSDLQTKADFSRYEKEGEEQKVSDQQLSLYFHLTEEEQSTFNIDISEGNKQQDFSFQLEQQHKEVFLCGFDDPIADYLQSMSNICVKVFLSDESWLYHLFKLLFCWLCIPLFFGSRSRTSSINQFLIWLHWKHEFT